MFSRQYTLLILLLVALTTCLAADNSVPIAVTSGNLINDSDILAEFNGGVITRKDLDQKISKIPPNAQGRYRTVSGQTQVLDVMAVEEVFMAKALQLGIDKEDDVRQKVDAGKRQFYIQEYYTRNVTNLVVLTEADKQKYYDENKFVFRMFPNLTINYIQAVDEAAALLALAELRKGATLTEVSDKYNTNTYAKGLKGIIKNIRLNGNIPGIGNDARLEELISAASANLNVWQGPILTTTGWHIFQVTEFMPGRDKDYHEVIPEIEQRLRPLVERRILDDLLARLKLKYSVSVDSTKLAAIDLMNPEKNAAILNDNVVSSSNPDLIMTVQTMMDAYSRISPQEQVFFAKGGGINQLFDQELTRALIFADAKANQYEQYFKDKDEYVQMERYYILNAAFRRLVLDTIVVSPEEMGAYYQAHIAEYTNPASRAVQALWFDNEKAATRIWKKYKRFHKLGDEKRMQNLVAEHSKLPNLALLDNQYNNGIVTGVGADADFSKAIFANPVGWLSPVFKSARGEFVFFRILRENPGTVKTQTEMEPRIYGILRKDKETVQQESVSQQLFTEFNMRKYPERIRLLLSAEELFRLADDAARMRNFTDAVAYYDQIIQNYKNGVDDYKASFMKAFVVAEEMKNEMLALDLFKAFLRNFPEGELNESAQFMIDTLEGKITLEIEE